MLPDRQRGGNGNPAANPTPEGVLLLFLERQREHE